MAIPAEASMNSLLKDDASAVDGLLKDDIAIKVLQEANKLLKGYVRRPCRGISGIRLISLWQILTISVFVESGEIAIFGKHDRAFVHKGMANYHDIIQAEVSGDNSASMHPAEENRGNLHVMGKYNMANVWNPPTDSPSIRRGPDSRPGAVCGPRILTGRGHHVGAGVSAEIMSGA